MKNKELVTELAARMGWNGSLSILQTENGI